jgi:hypothetical protein
MFRGALNARPNSSSRRLSSVSSSQVYDLTRELPGIPKLKPGRDLQKPHPMTTVLPNGLRVLSIDNYGQSSSVGVFINGGSRFERGTCAYLCCLMCSSSTTLAVQPCSITYFMHNTLREENVGSR